MYCCGAKRSQQIHPLLNKPGEELDPVRLWHLCSAVHGEGEGQETIYPVNHGPIRDLQRDSVAGSVRLRSEGWLGLSGSPASLQATFRVVACEYLARSLA